MKLRYKEDKMRKVLMLMIVSVFTIIIFTGCEDKKDYVDDSQNNDNISDELIDEELENNNNQKVSLLLDNESNEHIDITFDTERFAVEEYYLMEPQYVIYFTDKSNGSNYSIYVDYNQQLTVEDYYNKLVNTAKKNVSSDDFKATDMKDVTYGGVNFKSFNVSWSEEYEFINKDTGKLESGISQEEETAIFYEVKPGAFLRFDGPNDDKEILNKLFVKIEK